ncbi:transcriptional repressor [Candidatus Gracilibacteria bacterium]|nr:transcriptional repressor [Candidatus Gracilibacteria bacterium]
MFFLDFALKKLSEAGYRLTNQRKLVLAELTAEAKPVNAYVIAERVSAKGERVDVSTVYRMLSVFKELGLVHLVSQGFVRCIEFECENDKHCHHHFVCKDCGDASELHFEDKNFVEDLKKKFVNLEILEHSFEFSGLCGNCKS